jgi:hypothetical protein
MATNKPVLQFLSETGRQDEEANLITEYFDQVYNEWEASKNRLSSCKPMSAEQNSFADYRYMVSTQICIEDQLLRSQKVAKSPKGFWTIVGSQIHNLGTSLFGSSSKIGGNSADGFAIKTSIRTHLQTAEGLQVVVKTPQDEDGDPSLLHEAAVALELNHLRQYIPGFTYLYTGIRCLPPNIISVPKKINDRRQILQSTSEVIGKELLVCGTVSAQQLKVAEARRSALFAELIDAKRRDLFQLAARVRIELMGLEQSGVANQETLSKIAHGKYQLDKIAKALDGPLQQDKEFQEIYVTRLQQQISKLQTVINSGNVSTELQESLDALIQKYNGIKYQVLTPISTKVVNHLIYEYIDSDSLQNTILEQQSPAEILSIWFQVLGTLDVAFKKCKFVHNDLHHGNVLSRKVPAVSNTFVRFPGLSSDLSKDFAVKVFSALPVIIDFGRSGVQIGSKYFGCTEWGCSSAPTSATELSSLPDFTRVFVHMALILQQGTRPHNSRIASQIKSLILSVLGYISKFLLDPNFEITQDSTALAILSAVNSKLSPFSYTLKPGTGEMFGLEGLNNHIMHDTSVQRELKRVYTSVVVVNSSRLNSSKLLFINPPPILDINVRSKMSHPGAIDHEDSKTARKIIPEKQAGHVSFLQKLIDKYLKEDGQKLVPEAKRRDRNVSNRPIVSRNRISNVGSAGGLSDSMITAVQLRLTRLKANFTAVVKRTVRDGTVDSKNAGEHIRKVDSFTQSMNATYRVLFCTDDAEARLQLSKIDTLYPHTFETNAERQFSEPALNAIDEGMKYKRKTRVQNDKSPFYI